MADATLRYRITADDDAAATFDRVGSALDGTNKSFDRLSKGAQSLSDRISDTEKRATNLRREFERTGNVDVLKNWVKAERDLKRWRGHMSALGGDTDDASRKLGLFSRVGVTAGKGMNVFATAATDAGGAAKLLANPVGLMAAGLGATAGAALASGVALAGLGVGIIGLGAIALRNNAKVQASFAGLGATISGVGARAAHFLEDDFVDALNLMASTAVSTEPTLRRMFVGIEPGIASMSRGLDGLVRNAMPGLEDAAEGANDVLVQLGDELPDIGASVSRLGTALGSAASGGGKALTDTLNGLATAVDFAGASIATLSKTYEYASIGADNFGGIVKMLQGEHEGVASRIDTDVSTIDAAYKALGDTAKDTATAVVTAQNAMEDATLGTFSASLRGSEALRGLSASLQENGRSFTLGTEAGNDNRAALERVGAAARRVRDDAVALASAQGKDGPAAAAAGAAAQASYAAGLRQTLIRAGFAEQAIRDLFMAVGLIPPKVPIAVETKGDKAAAQKINDAAKPRTSPITARSSVNAAEGTLNRTARPRNSPVTARSSANAAEATLNRTARNRSTVISASASANAAEARLNSAARNRTATIYVRTVGSANALERRRGGIDYHMAGGGTIEAHHTTAPTIMYGERETGGEAFVPKNGDYSRSMAILDKAASWYGAAVVPAASGMVRAPSSGGSSALRAADLHFHFHGPVGSQRDAESMLLKAVESLKRQGRWR